MSSGSSRPNPSGNHAGSSSSRPHSHHKGHDQRRGSGRDAAQLISLGEQHSLLQEKSKGGFICKMKFSNELPDLPFDPVRFPPVHNCGVLQMNSRGSLQHSATNKNYTSCSLRELLRPQRRNFDYHHLGVQSQLCAD